MEILETEGTIQLANDFMFKSVFGDAERCRVLVGLVLRREVVSVEELATQHTMQHYAHARGAALDIRATLDDDTLTDIEMQQRVSPSVAIAQKARFYHDMLDIDGTPPGTRFRDLRDSCVVFFCMRDPFGKGRARYTFRSRCDEVPDLPLSDGQAKVFINLAGDFSCEDPRFAEFCRYLSGDESNIEDEFVRSVHEEVVRLRNSDDWRHELMFVKDIVDDYYDEIYDEGRKAGEARGIKRGIERERDASLRNVMASLGVSAAQAASILGLEGPEAQAALSSLAQPGPGAGMPARSGDGAR